MKNKVIIFLSIISIVLIIISYYYINKYHTLEIEYGTSIENIKAYNAELDNNNKTNRVFKLTIDQLNSMNDSIIDKMNRAKKELKIKDSKLKQLQYLESTIIKEDTIKLRDTIFVDNFNLDTIIGDKWYNTNIIMKYPNFIKIKPFIKLENFVFVSSKKETIKPPKKFFLLRWFQKKHVILNITVKENNPYVINKKSKFIEIIK